MTKTGPIVLDFSIFPYRNFGCHFNFLAIIFSHFAQKQNDATKNTQSLDKRLLLLWDLIGLNLHVKFTRTGCSLFDFGLASIERIVSSFCGLSPAAKMNDVPLIQIDT